MAVPDHVRKAYIDLMGAVRQLEDQHHALPFDSETRQGKLVMCATDLDNLAKWMLERTTCIQKEIANQMREGDLTWLVDNPHILEEIGLLQKDMALLKEGTQQVSRCRLPESRKTDIDRFRCEQIKKCMERLGEEF